MTQIAIIQPASPPIPPAGSPAGRGSDQFSSHFEKAVSGQKEPINTRENDNGKRADSQKNTEKSQNSASARKASQEAPATPQDQEVIGEDETIGTEINAPALSAEVLAAANVSFALPSRTSPAGGTPDPSGLGAIADPKIAAQGLIASSTTNQDDIAPSHAGEPNTTMPQAGQKTPTDTLLAQLQQLIDKSDETGKVTITREDSPPGPAGARFAQLAWPQQAGNSSSSPINILSSDSDMAKESPLAMFADGWKTPVEKSDQQVTSLRQNAQQQYYEAKINLQSFGNNDESLPQDRQQGNESTTQAQAGAGQTSSTATLFATEQTNTFAQSLATAQHTSLQPGTDAAKTVTLPSGTVVREEDVIQQVLERFHISRKSLDTQINLKLHPAELGELKIDLTVKEGSIRANVVAQSQHAQEILEKNMAKLRTVLEDHGFTIETITVTSKSDSTSDADLFDRQLFSQNDNTPQPRKRRHEGETAFRLDDAFFPAQPATTGVNVKI